MENIKDANKQFWKDLWKWKRENKQICALYDTFGPNYDQFMSIDKSQFKANKEVAQMLLLALEGNTEANIIDIACGTGLTGVALSEKGFKNIDGIEGSQGMLKMALEKNIHNHIFQMLLGEEDISQKISAGSYDAAVSVGEITANSITIEDFLRDVTRLVRHGGYAVYTVYDTHLDQSNPVDDEKPFHFMEVHTEYMRNKLIDLISVQQMPYYEMLGANDAKKTLLAYVFTIRIR